jgi:2,3,4,5-tetrahydropyridine-2-carboxylate N-succinyltransferase
VTATSSNLLEQRVERLRREATADQPETRAVVSELLDALESGVVRAAERDESGAWRAVSWVKEGILLGFRIGQVVDMSPTEDSAFHFLDKDTFPTRRFEVGSGIRIVPGGSTIRRGAFIGRGVVCMPPMFVNTGAWVGAATMVDSHALVGSCAQIGERVHLSAGAQIGGVLEPVNAAPVVIEDEAFVGGQCGIFEGTVVRARAVVASGVLLTRSTPVFDLVNERVLRGTAEVPLEIPSGAVVVPGARRVASTWGSEHGLSMHAPLIVKYRDRSTDASTALESALR